MKENLFFMFTCVNFQTALIALKKKERKREKQAAVAHVLPVCLGAEMKTSKQIQIIVPGTIFVQVCFFRYFVTFCVPVLSCHCWSKLL